MRLIIIDGLDAAGKDTHAAAIRDRYVARGETVAIRSHPASDNRFGQKAKEALLGTGTRAKIVAAYYYMRDVLRSVKLYYRQGNYDTVIMVRYLMGTAYLPLNAARRAYRVFERVVPTSPYQFLLDVTPDEALRRVESERTETELFETAEEFTKVRTKILALADAAQTPWTRIDTTKPYDEAAAQITARLDELDDAQTTHTTRTAQHD